MSSGAIARLSVERIRTQREAVVLDRSLRQTWLVLGSSQDGSQVGDAEGVVVVRRRGGGGAVLLEPDKALWVDLWIPAGHGAHSGDVRSQLEQAGSVWCQALVDLGVRGLSLAQPTGSAGTEVICFLGLGPGEVVTGDGRKLVGLTAWRSREGTLVQGALYRHRDLLLPTRLTLGAAARLDAVEALARSVADLEELGHGKITGDELATRLAALLGAGVERREPEVEAVATG